MRRWLMLVLIGAAGIGGGSLAQGNGEKVGGSASMVPPAPSRTVPSPSAERAVDPLTAALQEATAAHTKLRDYTCTFIRQQRRHESLGPEEIALLQVRVRPLGVRVRFVQPATVAGMELACSERTSPGKVRFRPSGPEGRKGFRLLEADDPALLAAHRYPLPEWTIGALVQRLAAALEREKALRNPVEVFTADYRYAQRDVTRYEVYLRRPHAFRPAARIVLFVDKQHKLPVRYEAYASAQTERTADLIEMFSYTDLRANVGLGEQTFTE